MKGGSEGGEKNPHHVQKMERNKSDYLNKTHKFKMFDIFQISQRLYIV